VKSKAPTVFSKESGNLIPINIILMHSDLNGNKTYISDEAVEEALPTINNIPILAYIKRDEDGDAIDFNEHDFIEKTDSQGNKTIYYLERPIGVIPETNNYKIEEINGLNHVVVEGYVWKSYSNEGFDLLSEGEKGVSMEIVVEDGSWDKKTKVFNINQFSYWGVTVLGDDVTPAMGNACKAEMLTSNTTSNYKLNYAQEIDDINNEIKKIQEEVKFLSTNKNNTQNYSLSIENLRQSIYNTLSDMTFEKEYSWGEKYTTSQYYLETILPEDNMVVLEDNSSNKYLSYGIPYTIESDNVVLNFDNKVEYIKTWRQKEQGEEVVVFSNDTEEKIVAEKFASMNQEITTANETITELNNQLTEKDSELETVNTTVEELKQFKLEKDQEALTIEVEKIIDKFSILDEEEFKELKDKTLNKEMEVKDLEFNLYALKGMKQEKLEQLESEKKPEEEVGQENFSQKENVKDTEPKAKVSLTDIEKFSSSNKYGALGEDLKRIANNNK